MGNNTVSGAASGAALGTSVLPGWGTAIGAGVGAFGGMLADKAERKKAAARAAALENQAQRRLMQGEAQAAAIKGQGQMDQTSLATRMLSSGAMTREGMAQDVSLSEIANRAQNESIIAIQNSQYDAQNIRQDIGAMNEDIRASKTASYFDAANSILGTVGKFNEKSMAAELAARKSDPYKFNDFNTTLKKPSLLSGY